VYASSLATYAEVSRLVRAGARCDLDQIVAIHKQAFPKTFGKVTYALFTRGFWQIAQRFALWLLLKSSCWAMW